MAGNKRRRNITSLRRRFSPTGTGCVLREQGAGSMKKILLLSMPMGALERPSLGLSLLKARLDELGVECDVRYLTFAFAEFIGQGNYQWMCYELPYTAFAGDWSFTQALYGERPEVEQEYIQKILREVWQL